jgi:hypothetical protein
MVCRKQVRCLGKWFTISFLFSCFKWFFSGIGDSCGFDNFPSLGLKAFQNMYVTSTPLSVCSMNESVRYKFQPGQD